MIAENIRIIYRPKNPMPEDDKKNQLGIYWNIKKLLLLSFPKPDIKEIEDSYLKYFDNWKIKQEQ